jgi:hypothetical protein
MRRHRDYLWRRDFFASITVVAADEIASAGKAAGAVALGVADKAVVFVADP